MSLRTVAALYVDPRGPYFSMPGVDPWDEKRDARQYHGPHPVVAHPPCGPWGGLRHLCTRQDPELALRAVDQVRAHGGVLEHPAGSKLWAKKGLPYPGDLWHDLWCGWSIEVAQVAWGHPCEKRTWLYLVGLPSSVLHEVREGGTVTAVVGSSRKKHQGRATKEMSAFGRRVTPPAFAEWLVSLARRSSMPPLRIGKQTRT